MATPLSNLGDTGESIAKKFLEKKGLRFLEQNFHSQRGEIDLIFYDDQQKEFVFVEVKTRKNKSFGDILSSIPPHKIQKIIKTGGSYLFHKTKTYSLPHFRIDAVFIQYTDDEYEIEYMEDLSQ